MSLLVGTMKSTVLSTKPGNGGYTLVEVLAAVLLLSIGLLAVMSAYQGARETQKRAIYLSIGRSVAQSRIEEMRTASFDSVMSYAGNTTDSSLPSGNSVVTSVIRYPTASETNCLKAKVTVTWPEGKGTRKIQYETLITRK